MKKTEVTESRQTQITWELNTTDMQKAIVLYIRHHSNNEDLPDGMTVEVEYKTTAAGRSGEWDHPCELSKVTAKRVRARR